METDKKETCQMEKTAAQRTESIDEKLRVHLVSDYAFGHATKFCIARELSSPNKLQYKLLSDDIKSVWEVVSVASGDFPETSQSLMRMIRISVNYSWIRREKRATCLFCRSRSSRRNNVFDLCALVFLFSILDFDPTSSFVYFWLMQCRDDENDESDSNRSFISIFLDLAMCGIWCIFGSSVDVHRQIPGCFNIAHRGPDCFRFENVNHFSRCVFGFHRLAIVDDIYGMQPMRLHALPHIWMVSSRKDR